MVIIEKGPYVEERLLKRIEAMNENEKNVIKTCQELQRFSADGGSYYCCA